MSNLHPCRQTINFTSQSFHQTVGGHPKQKAQLQTISKLKLENRKKTYLYKGLMVKKS